MTLKIKNTPIGPSAYLIVIQNVIGSITRSVIQNQDVLACNRFSFTCIINNLKANNKILISISKIQIVFHFNHILEALMFSQSRVLIFNDTFDN